MSRKNIVEWLKLYKSRIITVLAIVVILTAAFFAGDKPEGKSSQIDSDIGSRQERTEDREQFGNGFLENGRSDNAETTTIYEQSMTEVETTEENGNLESNIPSGNQEETEETVVTEKNGSAGGETSSENNGNRSENEDTGSNGTGTGNAEVNEIDSGNAGGGTENNGNAGNLPTEAESKKLTCTISISCATILNNMDKLDRDKIDLVPKDGWILKPVTVEFEENETVFDLLKRICMDRKIHMESSWTPMYGSAYIEGINNLYEFDCGSLSGWMYSVNGIYNNYGCSKAVIQDGDVIKWVYTCDLGRDV